MCNYIYTYSMYMFEFMYDIYDSLCSHGKVTKSWSVRRPGPRSQVIAEQQKKLHACQV